MAVHKPPTVPDCSNHSHPRGTGGTFGRQLGVLHFPHVLVTNAQTSVSRDQPFRHQGTNIQRIEKNTRFFIYIYILNLPAFFNSKPLKERGCLGVHIYILLYWYYIGRLYDIWILTCILFGWYSAVHPGCFVAKRRSRFTEAFSRILRMSCFRLN